MNPLVSIIIPTYNRCHLLGETLDSILAQSYINWECIVVDDGSSDYTKELVECYCQKDTRFKYLQRPGSKPKGANACRNFGLENSRGDFVNWFDSDDLMTPDFLTLKVNAVLSGDFDYVITKTECFDEEGNVVHQNENYYRFHDFPLTNYNYVSQNINWLTYDFFVKRELAEKVRFNEKLQAFQERNYFSKITCFSVKAKILDVYVTKVRLHANSIQSNLKVYEELYYKHLRQFFYETWKELRSIAPKESVDFLFNQTVDYAMHYKTSVKEILELSGAFLKRSQYRSFFWFLGFQISRSLTGRGYSLKKKVHHLR